MTYKVGPKGQVVVPKRIRERLGIRPGDEVLVEEDGEGVRIRKVDRSATLAGLLGVMADVPGVSTVALDAARREERGREEERIERWTRRRPR